VRIIAGTHRGHRIAAPKGRTTRPTSDRVRESLFNILGPVDGAEALDLFAGSGALGLEALSRGAADCVFVESDREACRTIGANLDKLGFEARTGRVLCEDALRHLARERGTFDLVLCDPPYDYPHAERLASALGRVVAPGGVLAWETSGREEPPAAAGLTLRTSRRYGSARLTLFET
jgi:16S rRNA (guanine(966)-N(2))-methyltransferase RsmD